MDNVLTFLLVVLLCGLQVAASDPDKASGRDNAIVTETLQPPFKTLSKTGAYEERAYEAGDYVAINVTGLPFTIAYTNGLSRLYAYFLGRNEDNVRMSRTQPSFTRMYPNEDFTDVVDKNYTISLWVPGHYQGEAPAPTVHEVKICHVPKSRGYSREFSGFATQGKALEEGLRLRAALLADKIRDFDERHLWLVGFASAASDVAARLCGVARFYRQGRNGPAVYDPPTKILHRRNEVLFDACDDGQHEKGPHKNGFADSELPHNVISKLHNLYQALFG